MKYEVNECCDCANDTYPCIGEDFTQHRKPKFIYCPNCGAKMD